NPRATRVTWRHNDQPLHHNVSAGVIVSNQSLVLQRVVRGQGGRYCCIAHNVVGHGSSNTLLLDVKYAPVCSLGQVTRYAVGRNEDAEVTCRVDASPRQHIFHWTFNNNSRHHRRPQAFNPPSYNYNGLQVLPSMSYRVGSPHWPVTASSPTPPMTSLDYGTLLCWAVNDIGTQKVPCVFHIVPAGKPEPPVNCTVMSGSGTSVSVLCEAGGSGGLIQHFHLTAIQIRRPPHHLHLINTPHILSSVNITAQHQPDFLVEGLAEGSRYQLHITAVNDKGNSAPVLLTITSIGTNNSVYQLDDGPSEAEVRDGGKKKKNQQPLEVAGVGETNDVNKPRSSVLALPSVMAGVMGIGSVVVLILILIVLLLAFRTRQRRIAEARHSSPSPSSSCTSSLTTTQKERREPRRSESTASMLSPDHADVCMERDMQVNLEADTDPDVIPMREGGGVLVVGDIGTPLPSLLPPATVLPTESYTCLTAPFPSPPAVQGVMEYSLPPPGSTTTSTLPRALRSGTNTTAVPYYPISEHLILHPSYLREATLPTRRHRRPQPGSDISNSTAVPEHMFTSSGAEMYVPLTREDYNSGGSGCVSGGISGGGGGAGRYTFPNMGTTTLMGPDTRGEEAVVPVSSVELGGKLLVVQGSVLNPSTDVLNSSSAVNNSSVDPSSEAELLLGKASVESFPSNTSISGGHFLPSGHGELITPPEHYPMPCFPVDPNELPPPPEGFLDSERTSEVSNVRQGDNQQEEEDKDSSVVIIRRSESSV
ncbi:hypothetical protein Pmani_028967, partial [Petrolisthes manimaculis]